MRALKFEELCWTVNSAPSSQVSCSPCFLASLQLHLQAAGSVASAGSRPWGAAAAVPVAAHRDPGPPQPWDPVYRLPRSPCARVRDRAIHERRQQTGSALAGTQMQRGPHPLAIRLHRHSSTTFLCVHQSARRKLFLLSHYHCLNLTLRAGKRRACQ
jgi:hypothetical protein